MIKEKQCHLYDIIFIGAGPSALFCASQLTDHNFLILEQGKDIETRRRAVSNFWPNFKNDLLFGEGGAGLFSDGKLNFSFDIGGHPADVVSFKLAKNIERWFLRNFRIKLSRKKRNIKVSGGKCLIFPQHHFGTDKLPAIIRRVKKGFKKKIKINSVVTRIEKRKKYFCVYIKNKGYLKSKRVVVATGQNNFEFPVKTAKKLGIKIIPSEISIGFRLEAFMSDLKRYFSYQYDPKFIFYTSRGEIRTFCSNPSGYVVSEKKYGFTSANGHALKNHKSKYGNFAILAKSLDKEYLVKMCQKISHKNQQKLIVQNTIDFINKKRTKKLIISNQHKNAKIGNIRDFFPISVSLGLRAALKSLIKIEPGINKSILYSPEIKVLHYKIYVKKNTFESSLKNIHFIGDSSGNIHGLWNAILSGLACGSFLKDRGTLVDV